VKTTSFADGTVEFQVHDSAASSRLYITTDLNVGSNEASLYFMSDLDGTANTAGVGQYADGGLRLSGAGNLVSPDITVSDAGDVGIGTTAPSGQLDVEGGDVFIGTGTLTNTSASEDLSVTGNVEVDGNAYVNGTAEIGGALTYTGGGRPKRTMVLTAAGAITAPQTGYASVNRTVGTNFVYYTADFDQSTDEEASWQFMVPDSLDSTADLVVTIMWTAAGGTAAQKADWEVSTVGLGDDAVFDSATGTATTINDALIATGDLHVTTTGNITSANHGWTAGEFVVFKVRRDADDATNDTLAADAKLVNVKIEWTASAESD
jgi:hypothetical protein